jgi:hypothetical protein
LKNTTGPDKPAEFLFSVLHLVFLNISVYYQPACRTNAELSSTQRYRKRDQSVPASIQYGAKIAGQAAGRHRPKVRQIDIISLSINRLLI